MEESSVSNLVLSTGSNHYVIHVPAHSCFDRESLSGCRAQGDLESIPSLPVASLDMASGSSQVSVKEPIVGKSNKYEVNDLVSSGEAYHEPRFVCFYFLGCASSGYRWGEGK
ncbi:hypothetical protein VNO77_46185 [Canavalia gladiata]|uniref:Uncharacterized protein n=1 Tax=Canavalia gladiata TaxID=3824 RepID=A0AAN9JIZ2_CANGL